MIKGTSIDTNFRADPDFLSKLGTSSDEILEAVAKSASIIGKGALSALPGVGLYFFAEEAYASQEMWNQGQQLDAIENMTAWGTAELASLPAFGAGWSITASATASWNTAGP